VSLIDNSVSTVLTISLSTLPNKYGFRDSNVIQSGPFAGNFIGKNQIIRNDIWITSKLNPKVIIDTPDEIIKSITKTYLPTSMGYIREFFKSRSSKR
jgi:hypothetical protein